MAAPSWNGAAHLPGGQRLTIGAGHGIFPLSKRVDSRYCDHDVAFALLYLLFLLYQPKIGLVASHFLTDASEY